MHDFNHDDKNDGFDVFVENELSISDDKSINTVHKTSQPSPFKQVEKEFAKFANVYLTVTPSKLNGKTS